MGDSEINKEVTTEGESGTQDKKLPKTEAAEKKKGGFFRSVKAEFKKVIWPDKDRVIKETTAVVIVTIILGVLIALLDFVIKLGIEQIIQIG